MKKIENFNYAICEDGVKLYADNAENATLYSVIMTLNKSDEQKFLIRKDNVFLEMCVLDEKTCLVQEPDFSLIKGEDFVVTFERDKVEKTISFAHRKSPVIYGRSKDTTVSGVAFLQRQINETEEFLLFGHRINASIENGVEISQLS